MIEIDTLKKPIGIQDQYIAAYGGLRFIEFKQDGEVGVEKIKISADSQRVLNDNFLLFYTGVSRKAGSVLQEQQSNIKGRMTELREIKQMAYEARSDLENGNFDAFGALMHRAWESKKRLADHISNGTLNDIYDTARRAGATGGKITGAGGGGFILLYAPYEKHQVIRKALNGLQELPFRLAGAPRRGCRLDLGGQAEGRRDVSGAHDEGHREGGPHARLRNAVRPLPFDVGSPEASPHSSSDLSSFSGERSIPDAWDVTRR